MAGDRGGVRDVWITGFIQVSEQLLISFLLALQFRLELQDRNAD